MKKKDKDKLKSTDNDELVKKLDILREKIRIIKFKAEGSKSKNVRETRTLKRDIARILTAVNNK